jgi:NTP pyrophosphatase (non-canonical NTP hydrolase)
MSAAGGPPRRPGDEREPSPADWGVREFQRRIDEVYGARDAARGVPSTFTWFVEEVGELARSLLSGERGSEAEAREFADVFAWLATLATLRGVDLAAAAREKYAAGCPRCGAAPCRCSHREG